METELVKSQIVYDLMRSVVMVDGIEGSPKVKEDKSLDIHLYKRYPSNFEYTTGQFWLSVQESVTMIIRVHHFICAATTHSANLDKKLKPGKK